MDHLRPTRAVNTRDAHIAPTREVLEYSERMKRAMPAWREEQIKKAHQALVQSKPKPQPTRRVTNPVLVGDLR